MPRESLDALDNLPKQALRQVALGQLQDEVPSVPMRRPPVLNNRCCRLVRGQLWMARGRTNRRRRLPRLYAMTAKSNRTSLARKRWQDLMLYCPDSARAAVRSALGAEGLKEMQFRNF